MARPYCTRADIEARFGEQNLWKWADYDGTVTSATISANISTCITDAGDLFDDLMRDSIYDLPVEDSDGDTPTTVKRVNVQLAAVECYMNRGIVDAGADGKGADLLTATKEDALATIEQISSYPRSRMRLDAVLKDETDGTAGSVVPAVVEYFTPTETTNPSELSES